MLAEVLCETMEMCETRVERLAFLSMNRLPQSAIFEIPCILRPLREPAVGKL